MDYSLKEKSRKSDGRRLKIIRFLLLFALCVISAFLDFFAYQMVSLKMELPLFVDTIFCTSLSMFAGPLWGILCCIMNRAVWIFIADENVILQLHIISAVTSCLIAWFFAGKYLKKSDIAMLTFAKLLIMALVLCIAISVTGGLTSALMALLIGQENAFTNQTQFISHYLTRIFNSFVLTEIFARIPVNFADRLITTFAGFGLLRLYDRAFSRLEERTF